MILLKVVIVLIVYFSCNVTGSSNEIPRLPYAKIDDSENVKWNAIPRIVGGRPATAGEFKGKISLQARSQHFCGGTLIHDRHVLTAAHCLVSEEGVELNINFYVLVGDDLNILPASATRQTRYVSRTFIHPHFNYYNLMSDVAVIRVNQPFTVTPTFNPVLRVENTPNPSYSCSVAGWGALFMNGPVSNTLQRINVSIIDRAICNGYQSYDGLVKDGMICAGNMGGQIDACQGDSGGGLICENYVTGIVSWGRECALPLFPGVYTEVAVFNNWIDDAITSGAVSILISINLIVSGIFVVLK